MKTIDVDAGGFYKLQHVNDWGALRFKILA